MTAVPAPPPPPRVRLGMPHLDAGGLSEGWLFRHAGDLHWDAISQRLGVASDDIRGDDLERLYPTVVALRARYTGPLSTARENDLFDGSVEMVPCGGACAHGRVSAAVGANRLSVELVTTFAARQPDGSMRMALPAARLTALWEPGSAPSRLALLARAARRGLPLDDAFAGPSLDPPEPALGRVRHQPSPYADYNGARLLYFAAYPTIADTAERKVVTDLGLVSPRADWALAVSPIARDVFYYGNLPLGDALLVDLLAFETMDDGVKTRVRLRRASDRVPIADVITRRVFVDADRRTGGSP
ncbi:MAG TPA: Pnap_2097 family protein [Polyangia bacterium]|nr:Pnap_2097 family protein [Polyangia bacterium]